MISICSLTHYFIQRMKIIINPLVNIYYASFYIQGLIDIYGASSILFDHEPFVQFQSNSYGLPFILYDGFTINKVCIDDGDFDSINQEYYEWCDVYGKVNTNWEKTPKDNFPKMVSLAPSFGIRIWDLPHTIYYALTNLLKSRNVANCRKFLGRYKRQFSLRLPIEAYTPEPAHENFVFHVSTLWQDDEYNQNDERVNMPRAAFMEVCKSIPGLNFEGGFYYSGNHPLNIHFKDMIFSQYMSPKIYLEKIKASTLVFNLPAYWNCHGWKLGEYLALGKAIISTPLLNELPEQLIHGVNIHFIKNDRSEMKEAIQLIMNDKLYRKKLELGARDYYLRNATPEKSLALLGINRNN